MKLEGSNAGGTKLNFWPPSSDFTKNDQSSPTYKSILASGMAKHPHPAPLTGLDLTLVEKCQRSSRTDRRNIPVGDI